MKGLSAALPKNPRGTGGWEAGREPAMCPYSPESQPYPGLHQKKCGEKVKRGDPALLFCTCEASLGVLHLDVESSVQERHGPVGAHPEEGHKNDPRDGTPILLGQAERAGAVQPGEEKALGRPESGISLSEGELKEGRGQIL